MDNSITIFRILQFCATKIYLQDIAKNVYTVDRIIKLTDKKAATPEKINNIS